MLSESSDLWSKRENPTNGIKMTVRIGTRGSKLALWQAEHVAQLLRGAGFETEIVPIETRGDKVLNVALSKIGSKGVFTEEIEAKLLDSSIDIAVHSAKDLLSELPDELELLAFLKREAVNDVVVSHHDEINLKKPGIRVGTSSTRRQAFLRHFYPKAAIIPVRGNLQTRLKKMKDGDCDLLILAEAGIQRMGETSLIRERLETSYFVPAVGQGSIALECHKKLSYEKKDAIRQIVNDGATETCIRAERAYLKRLQGGCSIPAFGYAQLGDGLVTIKAGIISLDGKRLVKLKDEAPESLAEELGHRIAGEVLAQGGEEILRELRKG